MRSATKIKARELRSVLKAVADAGVKVTRIEINASGSIAMLTSEADNAVPRDDEGLDKELAEFEVRNGHR